MATEAEMIQWIEKASFDDMVQKMRFEPAESPWFIGHVGEVFMEHFELKGDMNERETSL